MENILVIGAHFDDAELGCGGIMARFAQEGKKVYKLTLTDNVTKFKHMNIFVNEDESREDSAHACEIMGVTEITDFPTISCNNLTYSKEIMQNVEEIIFQKSIDTVFIHFDSDVNQDHIAASQISLTAARHCKNIFYYQSNGYSLNKPFTPTVYFDISNYYDIKKKALYCYRGDHNRFDRLFQTSLYKTEIWGYSNKVQYAEGFVPVKISL